ncbi:glycosyltransferase family 2 protein [Micromonospora sp. KC606]|nr:glycosyltransferase family 2 protein [Micromonospora sp. KC606]
METAVLSVVIPTYNDAHCLELTLRSLTGQTLPAELFEIIVVKDGRLSGYEGIERHGPGLNLRVETLPQRRGRSGARNAGIALASGATVLFLDSDCYADPQLLARHHAFHTERTGPYVLLGNRHEIDWPHLALLLRDEPIPPDLLATRHQDIKFAGLDAAEIAGCMQTPWLFAHSNNASVPRNLLTAVGGFNEEFGKRWGWEDLELFYRVYQHLDRRAEAFEYDLGAVSYHLPQHRDQVSYYQEMFENRPVLRRLHNNIDWEFQSMLPAPEVSAKVRYYRAVIEQCVKAGTGRLAPVWPWLARKLPPTGQVLLIGTGTGEVPVPEGALTFDYQAPPGSGNYHLIGVNIPAGGGALNRVVSVDVWRCLQWHDLCDFLHEATRAAVQVLLVHTAGAEVPHDAMRTPAEIDYLLRALAPAFHVTVEHAGSGITGITVRQRAG